MTQMRQLFARAGVVVLVAGAPVNAADGVVHARMVGRRPALVAVWSAGQASAGGRGPTPAGIPTPDAQQLRQYHDRIVTAARRLPPQVSLAELLRVVLPEGSGPEFSSRLVDDHRSALFALAFYVNGWGLGAFVPEARDWPKAVRRNVTVRGRHDLAQHFTVSAVIAAFAGTAIANAAGLYKEMDDARRGSGFSFSDLVADRAGTMFGEMATRSRDSARHLQTLVGGRLTEDDMMPTIEGLPDNLSQAEFVRRFGGVGAPAYNQIVEDIERRVSGLTLFK